MNTPHSPKFNADGSITLEVLFSHLQDWVPFRATATDAEPHGVALYTAAIAGEYGVVEPYIAPPPTVPTQITALQGLLALDAAGFSEQYDTWASSAERTFIERAFISKAMHWRRDDAVLSSAATALGITTEQLDGMFVLAGTL